MDGRLATVDGTERLCELSSERLGFGSVGVRSFHQPSPGLGLGYEIGRRLSSWIRHLCLSLGTVLCRVARYRNLLSYSSNDCATGSPSATHLQAHRRLCFM
ncbi:UNVERIFIED_CONTAM: hypothetical protein Sradi_5724800 [Sesamum radiatum]|uniref:Uncharacterized protein n=1 Tax=Sesamum radiatum TaxID=300843 RepID=A0AAW2L4S6_SESRA